MNYLAGQQFYAGLGVATVLPDCDFETYSGAGFVWQEGKWVGPPGAKQKGLPEIGAPVYAMDPTTEVLSFAYDLKDGRGPRKWLPGQPNPQELFDYLARGGLLEAQNVAFEWWIWNYVCTRRYGWPPLPLAQARCSKAKSQAFALPGALGVTAKVLRLDQQKDEDGKRLIEKFSVPRTPTKKDPRVRIRFEDDPEDAARMVSYNVQDIVTESEISIRVPDLPPEELAFWQAHTAINIRGVAVDTAAVDDAIAIMEECFDQYNAELRQITGGAVEAASQLARLKEWLHGLGVHMEEMDEDAIDAVLPHTQGPAKRALEIRQRIGSAAVKKLYAFQRYTAPTGRMHDNYVFHSAHTGRSAGAGAQLQNFPNSGPNVRCCEGCKRHYGTHLLLCPWCGCDGALGETVEWCHGAVEDALASFKPRSLAFVEYVWGEAFPVIAGSLRGMLCAAPGHTLVCSDYNAIEAVVLAALAGEGWRLDVFRTHGKIYEMSASKITGTPLESYFEYKRTTGQHHPDRKKIGKVAELASGFGGWIGAWKNFGADEFFTDDEIKDKILAWRDASPMIVTLWAQMEKCAHMAVTNPGSVHSYRGLSFTMKGGALFLRLPSGRYLTYHNPRLEMGDRGKVVLFFEGWNTNPKNGPYGWIVKQTYGGRLVENIVQAVANDILRCAIVRLETLGYPIVMHVHDEIVVEVPENTAALAPVEQIMSEMPAWALGWPVKASGGWINRRYGK